MESLWWFGVPSLAVALTDQHEKEKLIVKTALAGETATQRISGYNHSGSDE